LNLSDNTCDEFIKNVKHNKLKNIHLISLIETIIERHIDIHAWKLFLDGVGAVGPGFKPEHCARMVRI
jgi:hypothetical protein